MTRRTLATVRSLAPLVLAALIADGAAAASNANEAPASLNGFVLDPLGIDAAEIRAGGPPRDGIPALDHPEHVPISRSSFADDVTVIGVVVDGEARAYPIPILTWHELVNDTLGDRPILVSFCPLCGTGMVFDRRVADRERSFGVSGLLYRSDLLLYDRETESLWSQISAEAVTGPAQGGRLALVRSRMLPLGRWRAMHPDSSVLSRRTGHARDYGRSPYGDYATSSRLLFPARYDRSYHPKTPTLGLRIAGGPARGYPAEELVRAGGAVEERFAGLAVRVAYDADLQVFEVSAPAPLEIIEGYWFAWSAFHPAASVFSSGEAGERRPPSR